MGSRVRMNGEMVAAGVLPGLAALVTADLVGLTTLLRATNAFVIFG